MTTGKIGVKNQQLAAKRKGVKHISSPGIGFWLFVCSGKLLRALLLAFTLPACTAQGAGVIVVGDSITAGEAGWPRYIDGYVQVQAQAGRYKRARLYVPGVQASIRGVVQAREGSVPGRAQLGRVHNQRQRIVRRHPGIRFIY